MGLFDCLFDKGRSEYEKTIRAIVKKSELTDWVRSAIESSENSAIKEKKWILCKGFGIIV